jgi:hypothetical protein
MVVLKINIPDDKLQGIVNGFCKKYQYQEYIIGPGGTPVSNPESKVQFAKARLLDYVKSMYIELKVELEVAATQSAALIAANTDMINVKVE